MHMSLRDRDYLPTACEMSSYSGGAKEYLAFLEKELIPLINGNYRTDSQETTLFGDSYSGLFGLFALFNTDNLFNRYIIGSPSIYWDDAVIFDYEKNYNDINDDIQGRVFMSVGALEAIQEPAFAKMVDNVITMNQRLVGREYPNLKLTTHVFPDESHLSVIPATVSRGLRTVFRKV